MVLFQLLIRLGELCKALFEEYSSILILGLLFVVAGVTLVVLGLREYDCAKEEIQKYKNSPIFVDAGQLKPELGDIIEIDSQFYTHCAVYVGNRYVIGMSSSGTGIKFKYLCETIKEMADRRKVRIYNMTEEANRRGLTARSADQTVKTAFEKLGRNYVFNYGLLKYNCQHFATECRYGQRFSPVADIASSYPILNLFLPAVHTCWITLRS